MEIFMVRMTRILKLTSLGEMLQSRKLPWLRIQASETHISTYALLWFRLDS